MASKSFGWHKPYALRLGGLGLLALLLVGCGFHLRRAVVLPANMQRMHVSVSGGGELSRQLSRALELSGVELARAAGPGIAELAVSRAQFDTEALTVGGFAKVREYTVRYHVEFSLINGDGKTILAGQSIDMSREFTYDSHETLGTATAQEQIRHSLVKDMVQSIMRHLQASERSPAA
ncbi:MAG: LPS assembly lipoprotein LptE [Xanthomonadales bacterium]|nr:LPS assembly lipoprotein LptE [Xanthomonadales bacterium]